MEKEIMNKLEEICTMQSTINIIIKDMNNKLQDKSSLSTHTSNLKDKYNAFNDTITKLIK